MNLYGKHPELLRNGQYFTAEAEGGKVDGEKMQCPRYCEEQ